MKSMTIAAACVASALFMGSASAADMPGAMSRGYGVVPHRVYAHHDAYGHRSSRHHRRHGSSLFGLGRRSSAAGRAEQRHRTRLDRCENVPSRC